MMKTGKDAWYRILLFVFTGLLIFSTGPGNSCVGKVLTIGVANSPEEAVYAELISQLVTERTGTTVKVLPFKDVQTLYAAVRKGDVGVLIENTDRGMKVLERSPTEKGRPAFDTLKREYLKAMNLVWLEPVASEGGKRYYAPVISSQTIGALPALPKLINRLSGILTEESYGRLVRSAKGDDKPRRVARDFLKLKKLI